MNAHTFKAAGLSRTVKLIMGCDKFSEHQNIALWEEPISQYNPTF